MFGSGIFVWTCLCLLQNQNKQAVIFTKAQMYFYFLQRQTNISTKVLKTITTKMCHSFFLLISPPFLCLPAFFLCCSTCLLVKSSLGPHSCRQTKTFLTLKESPEVKFTQIISRLLPNLFGLFLNTIKR